MLRGLSVQRVVTADGSRRSRDEREMRVVELIVAGIALLASLALAFPR